LCVVVASAGSTGVATPAGKLQMHILGVIAEFERGRIVERVRVRLARAKAQGKRLRRQPYVTTDAQFEPVADRSLREAAQALAQCFQSSCSRERLEANQTSLAAFVYGRCRWMPTIRGQRSAAFASCKRRSTDGCP
jgi:DNA invertase Pin-like site-specific DNA recombinase